MKKNILNVAVIAIFGLSLLASSCTKTETSTTDNLTGAKNGWVLSKATSSPAYLMSDGITHVTDLMEEGYLLSCELDDVIKFAENGGLTVNPGKDEQNAATGDCAAATEYASTWSYDEETKQLYFQIPFFYDKELEMATVLSSTADEFRVSYTFNDVASPTKEIYTFTLTYTKK